MTITTKGPPASGCLFVVAAPSGGGKSSMVNALLEREPASGCRCRTRRAPPRPGEREGVALSLRRRSRRFAALKDGGEFLEHRARPRQLVRDVGDLAARAGARPGQDVLLEIDWQGAAQVRTLIPDSVHIFILPPSLAALQERLEKRGQDTRRRDRARLEAAREEMRHCGGLRLCYYESGLCACRRRPVRDRARGAADRAAPAGAPRRRSSPQLLAPATSKV